MKNFILCLSTLLILLSGLANAGQYENALVAHSKGDFAQAFKLLQPLAAKGNAKAQYNLGYMYEQGEAVTQDYKQAFDWYQKAASQGLAGAQYQLGHMYYKGQGVKQNYVRAHMWSNLAAAKSHNFALKLRELVSAQMTQQQIAEAKKLAGECEQRNYKNCD